MTTKSNDLLLDIRNLCIEGNTGDGWAPILRGLNLQLRRGEILGLIGESGSGKSTLGLASMGYVRPGCRITSGSVIFDGMDLATISEKQANAVRGSRMTYVAQSAAASFNPAHRLMDQTIETTTLKGIESKSEARSNAIDLFKALRLPQPDKIGTRYPHQVSGGQLQRVMTAMALSPHPDLIIFDEPTTALDVTTQVEVLESIRKVVREKNVAAIFITHDLAVVAQMADQIKVLRYGKTVEDGQTEEIIKNPKEEYTRSLWSVRMLDKPSEPAQDELLRLENIDAYYGKLQVLKNISFSVPRGRTLAIVGESGSGKSTTAKVISGLLTPSSGKLLLDGQALETDFRNRPRQQLQQIQMVNQMPDTALNPRQTIWDVLRRPVEFYFGLKGKALRDRVVELLEQIELDSSYLHRYPSALSGGQKQRICIARAIAAQPRLIICDEVTSALDQVVQEGILQLLLRLQKQLDMTYLFITHDIATVRAIADEVIVMFKGEIVEHGSKEEVLSPPYKGYTGRLLQSVPQIDTTWLDRHLAERANEGAAG